MALAEPGRREDGRDEVVPGHGHISMVFVAPPVWERGIGTALMSGLHRHVRDRGWTTLTLWTRENNTRAQRLYTASGYRRCGRVSLLQTGETIIQLQRDDCAADRSLMRFGLPASACSGTDTSHRRFRRMRYELLLFVTPAKTPLAARTSCSSTLNRHSTKASRRPTRRTTAVPLTQSPS